mmetsp:Transcript_13101/g.37684  ORF Transcript_13101/g.37684 Transcript_13101/m.37684 type:complete len:127 (-) Transcript_13101:35-415(-)
MDWQVWQEVEELVLVNWVVCKGFWSNFEEELAVGKAAWRTYKERSFKVNKGVEHKERNSKERSPMLYGNCFRNRTAAFETFTYHQFPLRGRKLRQAMSTRFWQRSFFITDPTTVCSNQTHSFLKQT